MRRTRSPLARIAAFQLRHRFKSLSVGIVFAMCAGLLLPALFGGLVLSQLRQDKTEQELASLVHDKMDLLSSSLVDPLWNVDKAILRTIAGSTLLDPKVVRVTIRDPEQKAILSMERPERRIGSSQISRSALVRRDMVLGSVELEIDNGLRQRELAQDWRSYLLVLLGQFVLALLFILVAIRRRILRPLARLMAFSDQLAGGNLEQPLNWTQADEIGRLALQMDQMRHGLRTSFAEQQAILGNVQVGVLFVRDRVIELANRYAEQMFGYAQGGMQGLPTRVVYLTDTQFSEIGQRVYEGMASGTGQFATELELRRRDGSVFLAHMRGCALDPAARHAGSIWVYEDITEARRAEAALSYSNSLASAALESTVDGILVVDAKGKISRWNQKFVDLWHIPAPLLLAQHDGPVLDFVTAQVLQPELFFAKVQALYTQPDANSEDTLLLTDGRIFERYTQPQRMGDTIVGRFWSFRDITERKQSEAKLLLAASVFSHAREGIMITAADGTIIDVNDTFTRITGYARAEVLGRKPNVLQSGRHGPDFYAALWRDLSDKGHWYGEIWNQRKTGEVYAEMCTISAVRDALGHVQHFVALFTDISAIKEHERQLECMAHFDMLTALPNRVLLADRLQLAMAQAQRRAQKLAVVYLDLDGFKAINDQNGHEAGDQVLIALAQRMQEALRETDTLARLGGDEFVAVLIDLDDQAASQPLVSRLLAAAALPVQVGGRSLQVSASLGVTFYPQAQDIDADQLLRQADQAMYQAKVAGKNRSHIFDAAQDSHQRGRHESLQRIRLALEQGEFLLYYQPKVNMNTGQVIGAEALIRWLHPDKGLLAPAMFLPVLEDHPLAVTVGEWVIDSALTQMELWQAQGLDLPVSVNIGANQLQQADFVERLKAILAAHPRVHPSRLELEVLETSALEDIESVARVIEDCAALGVLFALDDFGTGYSSLTYLKRLRVSLLKIDQSFVCGMLDDPDDLAILQGVIGLAAAFKRAVIAEGVETVAHGTALLQLGCELGQGYGIARPMPAAQMPAWAASWQPDPAWSVLPWLGGLSQ